MLLVLLGLALAGAGAALGLLGLRGVSIERVSIPGGEGRLAGLLVLPRDRSGAPLPALVFGHGLNAAKEPYVDLARRIALQGAAVLLIDFRGHGGSQGGSTLGAEEWRDLVAAVRWARLRPGIDPGRVAVGGHSLGGLSSALAGAKAPEEIPAVASVWAWPDFRTVTDMVFGPPEAFLGPLWPHTAFSHAFDLMDPEANRARSVAEAVGPRAPRNWLVILGSRDQLIRIDQLEKLVGKAAGVEEAKVGETYGRFEEGTARRLRLVRGPDHWTEAVSRGVARGVWEWLAQAWGIDRPYVEPSWTWARFSGWGLVAAGALLLAGVAAEGVGRPGSPLPLAWRAGPLRGVAGALLASLLVWGVGRRYRGGLRLLRPPRFFGGDLIRLLLFSRGGILLAWILLGSAAGAVVLLPAPGFFRSLGAGAIAPLVFFGLLSLVHETLNLPRSWPLSWRMFGSVLACGVLQDSLLALLLGGIFLDGRGGLGALLLVALDAAAFGLFVGAFGATRRTRLSFPNEGPTVVLGALIVGGALSLPRSLAGAWLAVHAGLGAWVAGSAITRAWVASSLGPRVASGRPAGKP